MGSLPGSTLLKYLFEKNRHNDIQLRRDEACSALGCSKEDLEDALGYLLTSHLIALGTVKNCYRLTELGLEELQKAIGK